MVFSSIEFLFLFLPVLMCAYYVTPNSLKSYFLLAFSLVFYAWGGGELLYILLFSIGGNYAFGLLLARASTRQWALWLGVTFNLAILFFYKYFNFVTDQLWSIPGLFEGVPSFEKIALPIGISFYTFQSVSYLVDVYRGEKSAQRDPFKFALYVALFPQIIAGPIVRYRLIADQLDHRTHTLDKFNRGAFRFLHGLFKKVIVADSIAMIADAAFNPAHVDQLGMLAAWIGLVAYTLQIYFDFSAYSDMAIGLGLMLGFDFPENFNRPYSATSVTDFWRRWHMTLSNWFRDYLYIPLGGNRDGVFPTYRNLIIVFLATGFWHGANWTFVLWGLFHGGLLLVERQFSLAQSTRSVVLRRGVTLLVVMLAWVIFRAENVDVAVAYYAALFNFSNLGLNPQVWEIFTHRSVLTLVAACAVFFLPGTFVAGRWLTYADKEVPVTACFLSPVRLYHMALLVPLLAIIAADVISGTFSPFLYFQF